MIKFKVYFRHGEPIEVEAVSGNAAREAAGDHARLHSTAVVKVKRVRS